MILEILEKEAVKQAENWAKKRRVINGGYPSVKEFFEMKRKFFKALCREAYNELSGIMETRDEGDF